MVISSGNKQILISLLSILIPLMFLSFLILLARVSSPVIKRQAEQGHPCLYLLLDDVEIWNLTSEVTYSIVMIILQIVLM